MNSNIPGRCIMSARIQSNGNSASVLQASQPEISAAARVATSDGTVRSSQSRKSGSSNGYLPRRMDFPACPYGASEALVE